jgi:hypothetical protein
MEQQNTEEYNVYLGYASFLYLIDKKGYIAATEGSGYILFWREGENPHRCELTIDDNRPECGFIYINTGTLKKIFNGHADLIQALLKSCISPYKSSLLPADKKDYHCSLDPSLWGKIETKIRTMEKTIPFREKEETVRCLHL